MIIKTHLHHLYALGSSNKVESYIEINDARDD